MQRPSRTLLDANNFNNTINVNSSFRRHVPCATATAARTRSTGSSSAAASFVTIDGGTGLDNVNVNSDGAGTAIGHFDTTQDLAVADDPCRWHAGDGTQRLRA